MKKGILFTAFSLLAVFGMVTMASANSVQWVYFTYAPDVGVGPGADLLMGEHLCLKSSMIWRLW